MCDGIIDHDNVRPHVQKSRSVQIISRFSVALTSFPGKVHLVVVPRKAVPDNVLQPFWSATWMKVEGSSD
jgi:hypothetical protein